MRTVSDRVELDEVQRQLVRQLQRNARTTNRELATRVGLAPSSTSARVKDLEDRGVITGYRAEVDLPSLGRHLEAMVFVRLDVQGPGTVEHFLSAVSSWPETLAVHLLSGVEDALVHVAVPDVQWLRNTVIVRIAAMPEVTDERTSIVFESVRSPAIEPLS